ncbi:hypothetical protein B5P41_30985, partial [Bacillus sp. SRB_28]
MVCHNQIVRIIGSLRNQLRKSRIDEMLAAIDRVAGGGESAVTKGDSLGMPGGVVFLTMTRTLKCQLHSQFPLSLQSGPNFRTAVKSCSRRSLNTYHWYEMSGQVLVVNSCTDGKYFGSRYFTDRKIIRSRCCMNDSTDNTPIYWWLSDNITILWWQSDNTTIYWWQTDNTTIHWWQSDNKTIYRWQWPKGTLVTLKLYWKYNAVIWWKLLVKTKYGPINRAKQGPQLTSTTIN